MVIQYTCVVAAVVQEIDPRCGEALCKLFPVDENLDISPVVRKARKAHARNAERSTARPARSSIPDRGRFMRRPDFGPRLAPLTTACTSPSCSVCCHRGRGVTWCVLLWDVCRALAIFLSSDFCVVLGSLLHPERRDSQCCPGSVRDMWEENELFRFKAEPAWTGKPVSERLTTLPTE